MSHAGKPSSPDAAHGPVNSAMESFVQRIAHKSWHSFRKFEEGTIEGAVGDLSVRSFDDLAVKAELREESANDDTLEVFRRPAIGLGIRLQISN